MVTAQEAERINSAYENLLSALNEVRQTDKRYVATVTIITELVAALAESAGQTVPETYKDIVAVHRDIWENGAGGAE